MEPLPKSFNRSEIARLASVPRYAVTNAENKLDGKTPTANEIAIVNAIEAEANAAIGWVKRQRRGWK